MNKEFQPLNMMEQVVDLRLMELMHKSEMCTCGRCCADVRAIVLNSLPPKYVVTRVGEAMLQFELLTPQMQAIVVSEIMIAIEKVSRNPRHNGYAPPDAPIL
jgi:competence protein ComFB